MMPRPLSTSTIALMYHAVGVDSGPGVDPHYSVSLSQFSSHLGACLRQGPILCVEDWLEGRSGVIFTFDDGHASNHRFAWPALAEIGGRADFFVNPAQVGTPGFASWGELREMSDAGMSIQSHGLDHRHYLTELTMDALREELRRSKSEIEDRMGRPVTLLSPPGGRRPPALGRIAEEVGFRHILDSRPAVIRRRRRQTMGRYAVTSKLDVRTIESWIRGGLARKQMEMRYLVLSLAKGLMGDKRYEQLRSKALRRS